MCMDHRQNSTSYSNNQFNNIGSNSGGYKAGRSHIFCDYCKKPGHTEDKCYRLHGFPQDFKFTKGRNSASASHVCGIDSSTKDGNNHVLLNNQDKPQGTIQPVAQLTEQPSAFRYKTRLQHHQCAVNFAGIIACHSLITMIGELSSGCDSLCVDSLDFRFWGFPPYDL
ncbi:hypothetical protein T459_15203 [Capsicum annuum]|uniref:Uncharacterized protein n=1 Tax=Capsicum annuum TaxID=4072 RepID=A0A2G2ZJL7_CAPAN|nr:hypothetical protein T459_15203 [Capsicum annuum]